MSYTAISWWLRVDLCVNDFWGDDLYDGPFSSKRKDKAFSGVIINYSTAKVSLFYSAINFYFYSLPNIAVCLFIFWQLSYYSYYFVYVLKKLFKFENDGYY